MMHIFGIQFRDVTCMRLRFTIRDLLWHGSLALGWWLDTGIKRVHEQYKQTYR